MATAKYTFESPTPTYEFRENSTTTTTDSNNKRRHVQQRWRSSSDPDDGGGTSAATATTTSDLLDGNGSLTYSAASSVNSCNEGESTDSSFADILRVLDVQDSKDLAQYLRPPSSSSKQQQQQHNHPNHRRDEKSVSESLAYSTDAESHLESQLHGADLISTITGHSSSLVVDWNHLFAPERQDHNNPATAAATEEDGGGEYSDIMFSPAEHTDSLKRRKAKKRRERLLQQQQQQQRLQQQQQQPGTGTHATPRSKNHAGTPRFLPDNDSYNKRLESRQGTPPSARPPKSASSSSSSVWETNKNMEEEDVWYAKWWYFCFPDAVKNMTMAEKR